MARAGLSDCTRLQKASPLESLLFEGSVEEKMIDAVAKFSGKAHKGKCRSQLKSLVDCDSLHDGRGFLMGP
jgi:hypothetical protein